MFQWFKRYVLAFKSPIRWATIALFFAISLFFFEISLSLYSVYLSFVGGGVVVPFLFERISFVMFVVFGIVGIGIFVGTILIGIAWLKDKTPDDIAEIKAAIREINEKLKKIDREKSDEHTD